MSFGPGPLTIEQLVLRLRRNTPILWNRAGSVEIGHVVFFSAPHVSIVWLEGYKSRNDDVLLEDVLAVSSPKGPHHTLAGFSGRGFLTEAGVRCQQVESLASTGP